MRAGLRVTLFGLGALVLALCWLRAADGLPRFGTQHHPQGDRATAAAKEHRTANAVASVSFDQRGFDTLGEEFVLVTAVLGTTLLMRRQQDEEDDEPEAGEESDQAPRNPPTADVARLGGYLLLPVTVVVGLYVVAHGHLSPGGGFQGGVVLATALHLLYLAGDYPVLDRLRPVTAFETAEAVGATLVVVVGLAGLGTSFLANALPQGTLGDLLSAGTVPLLQGAVGVAVTSSVVLLLTEFLEQALVVRPRDGA